ncbi:MAG: hypothetical protein WAP51_02940 [Candidatus Sungiibacteriota bacterium]
MEHEFLKEKYGLHKSPEVNKAAERAKQRTGEKVPQNPDARIQNYLDRLERLALDPEKKQGRKMFGDEPRPRALMLLREMIMNRYVRPHKEKMAEGAARVEERAAREMGIEARYGEQELEQRGEIAVEDLEKSLDQWISYLSDANEPYPVWFRYYAFRNVLDLGDYDKDKGEFTKRSPRSVRLFPEIDRGALAYVEQMVESAKDPEMLGRLRRAQETTGTPSDQLLTKEKAAEFAKLSFAKQYAEGIKQAGEITKEMREETRGKWVKYQKGTNPTALWASLQNKGTAWCTKGFATAETQLKGGDFYVYYTHDRQGKPSIPRIAIRMQEDYIGEVRGVADNDQNLEGNMAGIAEEKMKELPGAEKYKKASADMQILTAVEKKSQKGEPLAKDELVFLYELNASIEGFGYQRDPRIAELRGQRNPEEDMPIVFECDKDQIAHNANEIKRGTKAYVGKLVPGIFDKIQEFGIEHVYTSFPEGRIRIEKDFEVGPLTLAEFEKERERYNRSVGDESLKIQLSDYAKDMMRKIGTWEHPALKEKETFSLVRLKVGDLDFPQVKHPTTDEIYKRIKELGLELCPPETGPQYRIKYTNQPMGEWFRIGMTQIADRDGNPSVFELARHGYGLWLRGGWTGPAGGWSPGSGFVFRLRKLKLLKT